VAVSAPLPGPVDNVVVTATFRKVGGPPGGGYGLIIRDQDPSASDGVAQTGRYLVLEAGDRGEIGIWRRDENAWVDVLSWTPSDAVHKGNEANTLEASAVGQRLTFLVNGTQVASAVDASLQGGGVGVFVGGDGNDVELDHLLVRVPDQTAMSAVAARNDVAPQQPATPNAKQASIADPTATPTSNRPVTRVVIPSISLDAPSVPVGLVRQDSAVTWDVPPFKIGYALETGGAGDPGNAVLVGHVTSRSLGNVFEHLHEVRVGDAVQLFSDQAQFTYRVVDVRTVARNDVSVVEPTATPSATLITCTGAWIPVLNDYAQRLVVRAELVQSD
jgi:sortase A